MKFREAEIKDISQIQVIRHLVKENVLLDPSLVTDEDCRGYLTVRGKGWVCEIDDQIVGFAIADLKDKNIWALFIQPEYECKGIGTKLHDMMMNWYFGQGPELAWLTTDAGTKADKFYKNRGWKYIGKYRSCEIRLELTTSDWEAVKYRKAEIGYATL